MSDPFSMVFDALWDLVEASDAVTSRVKPGNRIKYNSLVDRSPQKREAMKGDYPELELVFTSATGNLHSSSSTSMVTRQYEFGITVGDFRATALLLPLEFALYAALADWKSVLFALEWPEGTGRYFVKSCSGLSMQAGVSVTEKNRGIQGWTSLWACEVQMHFRTADLIAHGAGTGTGTGTGS